MNNTSETRPPLAVPSGSPSVGDIAELTLTRSSQGDITLEIRLHNTVKLRIAESDFVALIFGRAHCVAEVLRCTKRPSSANDKGQPVVRNLHSTMNAQNRPT